MKGRAVSRISVCTDPSRWHGVVIAWLDRRLDRLKKKRKNSGLLELGRRKGSKQPPPGVPFVLKPRFLWELPIYLELAERSVRHANAIVAHFYTATKKRKRIDPRVVEYIDKARDRYCRDPRRNIAKALGLVRSGRGNPGRVPSKRRLTPEGFIEAGQMVMEEIKKGKPENYAVDVVAEQLQVSPRTVRKSAAAEKRAREWRQARRSREFPE